MQRYVQAILSSADFDKDVFDMKHFGMCHLYSATWEQNLALSLQLWHIYLPNIVTSHALIVRHPNAH